MEKPQLVCRVGRTPTWEFRLFRKPGCAGAGMFERRLAESALKHEAGILFPGHCVPGAGAVHPAGATNVAGTKMGVDNNALKSPPTSACVGTVMVPVSV